MKVVGIIANHRKPEVWTLVPELVQWLMNKGWSVAVTDRITGPKYEPPAAVAVMPVAALAKNVEMMISIGGDGTILSTARVIGKNNVPILGIHMGGLGFLAEVVVGDIYGALEKIQAGKYRLENKMVLAVDLHHAGNFETYYCINDLVVSRGDSPRLLSTKVEISGRKLNEYIADGLIVATPTGSTAYSLAAGGPIIVPTLAALTITPICPHSLSARPIVVPSTEKIAIRFDEKQEGIALTLDGQVNFSIDSQAVVTARQARWDVQMVRLLDSDYYNVLRTKMGWSGEARGVNKPQNG